MLTCLIKLTSLLLFSQPSELAYESGGSETEKDIIIQSHKEEKIPLVATGQDKGTVQCICNAVAKDLGGGEFRMHWRPL